jgi:hypothetical protein
VQGEFTPPPFMADGPDLYWLAGLLEGEGSFFPGPPSAPNRPTLVVNMTDEDVVARAAALLGVKVYSWRNRRGDKTHWKTAYRAGISGRQAVALMLQLRPLMGRRRREQIDRVVASFDWAKALSLPYGQRRGKLTPENVLAIYRRGQSSETTASLAREFGVSQQSVQYIRQGRSWRWLTQPEERGQPWPQESSF